MRHLAHVQPAPEDKFELVLAQFKHCAGKAAVTRRATGELKLLAASIVYPCPSYSFSTGLHPKRGATCYKTLCMQPLVTTSCVPDKIQARASLLQSTGEAPDPKAPVPSSPADRTGSSWETAMLHRISGSSHQPAANR